MQGKGRRDPRRAGHKMGPQPMIVDLRADNADGTRRFGPGFVTPDKPLSSSGHQFSHL